MERGLNTFARRVLGFFFTSAKLQEEGTVLDSLKNEHAILASSVKLAGDLLREKKIRSSNVNKNWEELGKMIETVGQHVSKEATTLSVPSLIPIDAGYAYASAILFSIIGNRNDRIEKLKNWEAKNTASADKAARPVVVVKRKDYKDE